jgi:hypothetical protein
MDAQIFFKDQFTRTSGNYPKNVLVPKLPNLTVIQKIVSQKLQFSPSEKNKHKNSSPRTILPKHPDLDVFILTSSKL